MNFGGKSYKTFFKGSKSYFTNSKQFANMNFNNKFFSNFINSKLNTSSAKGMFTANYHLNTMLFFSGCSNIISAFKFTQMLPIKSGDVNNELTSSIDSKTSAITIIDGISFANMITNILQGNNILLNDKLLAQLKEVLHKVDVV